MYGGSRKKLRIRVIGEEEKFAWSIGIISPVATQKYYYSVIFACFA